jgi:hypothetical protein
LFKFLAFDPSYDPLQSGNLKPDYPEEERKQKAIKSLLNKITPEKYVVIRDKILAAKIDSPLSLHGLIDQVLLLSKNSLSS